MAEIKEEIEAWKVLRETELRHRASMLFTTANLISLGFNEPKKFPRSVDKAFPGLFSQNQDDSWKIVKANMKSLQRVHNAKLKGGENI